MQKRFLITGCARSGTRYIARLITKAGRDCRHEQSGQEGTACWYCCAALDHNVQWHEPVTRCGCRFDGVGFTPSGDVAMLGSRHLGDYYGVILHQLRHPLKAIASAQTLLSGSFRYIGNKIGDGGYTNRVLQATRYWIEWNRRAQAIAAYSYRIEDLEACWPTIADMIELDNPDPPFDAVPRNTNTRQHEDLGAARLRSMDSALFEELQDVAAGFGYTLEGGR